MNAADLKRRFDDAHKARADYRQEQTDALEAWERAKRGEDNAQAFINRLLDEANALKP